jgi:PEP-CTERM motif
LKKSKRELKNHPRLEKKIAAYAIASAAVLAAPAAAHASVVYTAVNQTFDGTDAGNSYTFDPGGLSSDDITLEAILDVPSIPSGTENDVDVSVAIGAGIVETFEPPFETYATALSAGSAIGSASNFGTGGKLASNAGFGPFEPQWPTNGDDAYLGFYITDGSSNKHYGWAEISAVAGASTDSFTLVGYAYETNPNESINAGSLSDVPEPSSLALVALGAAGLAILRRRRAAHV